MCAVSLPAAFLGIFIIFFLLRKKLVGARPSARKRKRDLSDLGTGRKARLTSKLLAIDFVGATLFIGGSILLLLGLNWGSTTSSPSGSSTSGWSTPRVIILLAVGGAVILIMVLWEFLIERYDQPGRSAPLSVLDAEPLIPAQLVSNWDTIICQYVSFTSGMVMFVMFYFVAIFFTVSGPSRDADTVIDLFPQIVSGQSAKKAGGQLVYFAPGMVRCLLHL